MNTWEIIDPARYLRSIVHNDDRFLSLCSGIGLDLYKLPLSGDEDKVTEKTIGIHWYNGSAVAKQYLNNFEERRHDSSIISKYIRRVGCFL